MRERCRPCNVCSAPLAFPSVVCTALEPCWPRGRGRAPVILEVYVLSRLCCDATHRKALLLPRSLGMSPMPSSSGAVSEQLCSLPLPLCLHGALTATRVTALCTVCCKVQSYCVSDLCPFLSGRITASLFFICKSCLELAGLGAGSSWQVVSLSSRFLWSCISHHLCLQ